MMILKLIFSSYSPLHSPLLYHIKQTNKSNLIKIHNTYIFIKKLGVFLILLNIFFNIVKIFIFYLKYKYVILQKEVINMNAVPMWMKNLDDEDMIFIKRFLLASGSLKEVAKLYGVTYPTVRVRLNKLIDKIKLAEDKTDNDEFVELIKRYVIDEDIEFDVAKNLITEYKKIKEKSKNG